MWSQSVGIFNPYDAVNQVKNESPKSSDSGVLETKE